MKVEKERVLLLYDHATKPMKKVSHSTKRDLIMIMKAEYGEENEDDNNASGVGLAVSSV